MRRLGLDSEPATALRTHAKVAVTPGHTYGNDTTGYIRLNFATSVELLTKAISRIATATAYRTGVRRG